MSPMVGKLYMMELSPPCRAVMLTAKALGIDLDLEEINLFKGQHLKPEFLKLNPMHSAPTYVDNDGTTIGDSHAIMAFLVDKYGRENNSMYPSNVGKRAAVDQRLHFDSGNVYSLHRSIVIPMYAKMATGPSEGQIDAVQEMYTILNMFLDGHNWVAGTLTATIADLSLFTSISCISIMASFDKQKFANIDNWMKRCQDLPFIDVNTKGQEIYAAMLNAMLNNNYDFMN